MARINYNIGQNRPLYWSWRTCQWCRQSSKL